MKPALESSLPRSIVMTEPFAPSPSPMPGSQPSIRRHLIAFGLPMAGACNASFYRFVGPERPRAHMDEEERIKYRNAISRERRSHQITWFFVLQLAGILIAGNIAPPSQQAGSRRAKVVAVVHSASSRVCAYSALALPLGLAFFSSSWSGISSTPQPTSRIVHDLPRVCWHTPIAASIAVCRWSGLKRLPPPP